MKFRKRPVIIDAVQFNQFSRGKKPKGVCFCNEVPAGGQPHVHTLEGFHLASDGDWIITGVKGEQYPCKPDIFSMTYERVKTPKGSPL